MCARIANQRGRMRTTTLLDAGGAIPHRLVVPFYRPPGLADDDGTRALDACRVPQHAQVEFAWKIAAHARQEHPGHLTVVARVAAGDAAAHPKAADPSP